MSDATADHVTGLVDQGSTLERRADGGILGEAAGRDIDDGALGDRGSGRSQPRHGVDPVAGLRGGGQGGRRKGLQAALREHQQGQVVLRGPRTAR